MKRYRKGLIAYSKHGLSPFETGLVAIGMLRTLFLIDGVFEGKEAKELGFVPSLNFINPSNVSVSWDAKFSDPLEYRLLDEESDLLRLMPGYQSPEQRRGVKKLTPASDLYCVGLVMWSCLTGSTKIPDAFYGGDVKIDKSISYLNGIGKMIEKLLRLDPNRRYQDAEALYRDYFSLNPGESGVDGFVTQKKEKY